jgi:hypothetical protein
LRLRAPRSVRRPKQAQSDIIYRIVSSVERDFLARISQAFKRIYTIDREFNYRGARPLTHVRQEVHAYQRTAARADAERQRTPTHPQIKHTAHTRSRLPAHDKTKQNAGRACLPRTCRGSEKSWAKGQLGSSGTGQEIKVCCRCGGARWTGCAREGSTHLPVEDAEVKLDAPSMQRVLCPPAASFPAFEADLGNTEDHIHIRHTSTTSCP